MTNQCPKIGILRWQAGHVPRGLMQLESLRGNSTNPESYRYPVRLHPVRGANIHTILENPSRTVMRTMIDDARMLAAEGVKAITTSCGFNAIFQAELAEAVPVPVFTSSLLQVPLTRLICGANAEIAIITAKAAALRPEHMTAVGIHSLAGLHILGLEHCPEWGRIFTAPEAEIDLDTVEREVLGTAQAALQHHPAIRAFVLECTDLPPYAAAIRQRTGLPVFDFITLVDYLHASL